jgi:hypothetical protein
VINNGPERLVAPVPRYLDGSSFVQRRSKVSRTGARKRGSLVTIRFWGRVASEQKAAISRPVCWTATGLMVGLEQWKPTTSSMSGFAASNSLPHASALPAIVQRSPLLASLRPLGNFGSGPISGGTPCFAASAGRVRRAGTFFPRVGVAAVDIPLIGILPSFSDVFHLDVTPGSRFRPH